MTIQIPDIEIIDLFKRTPGAISLHEFFAISWLAEQAPAGACLDIGSNAGKAAVAESIGLSRQGMPRDLFCIDTVFDLENAEAWKDNRTQEGPQTTGWSWIYERDFHDKVKARIGQASRGIVTPKLIGESALTAIPKCGAAGVAFAFCDADNNQRWLVDGIVDALAPLMVSGGIIAHHDFESQFIAPHEAQERLLAAGGFERVTIPWEEIKEVVDSIGGDHGDNVTWHHKETARPMFVGAIRRI